MIKKEIYGYILYGSIGILNIFGIIMITYLFITEGGL